jgi:RNA polymerase sigma-B factor
MIARSLDEELFHAHRHLCGQAAKRFVRAGFERCDLEQVAAVGLIKACSRFDPRTGTPFEAFAWVAVMGELLHFVRDNQRPIRLPRRLQDLKRARGRAHDRLLRDLQREPDARELAEAMGVAPSALWELERALHAQAAAELAPDARCAAREESAIDHIGLDDFLKSCLSSAERTIVVGIYRLGFTQAELARRLQLSARQVSRLHERALESLARRWPEFSGDGYCIDRRVPVAPRRKGKMIAKHRLESQRGFTLLELMIVVAIVAILAGILMPNFFHARAQAAISACESNIRSIMMAAELYYSDNQTYPGSGNAGPQKVGSDVFPPGNPYLTQTPRDPGAANPSDPYTFTPPAVENGPYQIDCPAAHPGNAFPSAFGTVTGNAGIHYDSSSGFSAVTR